MAKTTGPLMSLDASGSVAGTIVFSKWKGRNYVRQLVRPSNPQSAMQMANRAMFSFLGKAWSSLGGSNQDSWAEGAAQLKVSEFNNFMKEGQARWAIGKYPYQFWPLSQATYTSSLGTNTATGGVRQATLVINPTDVAGTTWGTIIYRSLTTGFTPTISDVIAVLLTPHSVATNLIDTPLAADTYYYRCVPFSTDGQLGTMHAEINAVVTG